ncbi:hypothetical protein [Nonomuraea sp. NPDC005501]
MNRVPRLWALAHAPDSRPWLRPPARGLLRLISFVRMLALTDHQAFLTQ